MSLFLPPFAGSFWRLAKKSDWQSIRTFDDEFEAMRSLVEAQRNDGNGDTIDKALKWLGDPLGDHDPSSLFARRRKWAARYTHALFTYGADATQSGEALFKGARARSLPMFL